MTSLSASIAPVHPVPRPSAEARQAVIERARQRARRRHRLYGAVALALFLGLLVYAGIARGGASPSGGPTVAAPTRAGGDYSVVLGHRVGSYSYDTHGRYRDAVDVFGSPTQTQATDPDVCEASWPSQGIALAFRSPSSSPCSGSALRVATWTGASILSGPWTVDRGLRIGATWSRVRQLYPSLASFPVPGDGTSISLAQRAVPLPHTRYSRYAEVSVTLVHGRVARIDIYYN